MVVSYLAVLPTLGRTFRPDRRKIGHCGKMQPLIKLNFFIAFGLRKKTSAYQELGPFLALFVTKLLKSAADLSGPDIRLFLSYGAEQSASRQLCFLERLSINNSPKMAKNQYQSGSPHFVKYSLCCTCT
jgi:hypothetical protein